MIEMFQSQWATNLAATPLLVGAITFHEGDGDALGPPMLPTLSGRGAMVRPRTGSPGLGS